MFSGLRNFKQTTSLSVMPHTMDFDSDKKWVLFFYFLMIFLKSVIMKKVTNTETGLQQHLLIINFILSLAPLNLIQNS